LDRNVILAFALSMAVFSGWLAWQENIRGPERRAAIEQAREAETASAPDEFQQSVVETPQFQPAGREKIDAPPAFAPSPGDTTGVAIWNGSIESEVVLAELTNRGATLTGWRLNRYYETPSREVEIEILDLPPPYRLNLTTPFSELGLGDLSEAVYEVESASATEVTFLLRRGEIEIRKRYASQHESDYGFSLEIEITNNTDRVIAPRYEVVWPAVVNDRPDFRELSLVALADGDVTRELVPGVGQSGFFSNLFGNGDEGPTTLTQGVQWAGIDLTYFAGLLIPDPDYPAKVVFTPLEAGKSAAVVMSLEPSEIAPGQSESRQYLGFIGPKDPNLLASLGRDFDKAISRGWSWIAPLTTFFSWALHAVYAVVPNFGLAIILITVLVRLATWPIMARQMKSAERMRELMPSIKELQEKYKDDRQKQSEETFKLYRETGVNPLGGCLPMVLQLPVFIGLFYALQSSFDLRHAPFFLWINDLSAPATLFMVPGVDLPFRLLPILMGASMFAQQKMMPQTGMDPAQAKMMLIMMPGMMLVISYSFPSGLVLYWMVSNILGIAHQLLVRRKMQASNT
jgi:YidC/Oxa1 family membrane protein insertase